MEFNFDGFFDGMGAGIANGAIGGISSAITSAMSTKANKDSQMRSLELNRMLQQQAYDLNQKSLLESPTSHKQGLLKAGYNPMLALGNLSSPTVSAQSVAATSPSVGLDFGSPVESALAARRLKLEKELNKNQIVNLKANSAKALADADEALARADKTRKESSSIDPETEKENRRYGIGKFIPDVLSATRYIWDRLPFDSNSAAESKMASENIHPSEKTSVDWSKIKTNKNMRKFRR